MWSRGYSNGDAVNRKEDLEIEKYFDRELRRV